jgi:cytochrome c-type protein NapB
MKRAITTVFLTVLLLGVAAIALTVGIQAQAQDLQSLRGMSAIPETNPPPDARSQDTGSGQFSRAYRQQPPLIPHEIEDYRIDLRDNECLQCHDWPYNVDQGAPKISETHYTDRDGVALDRVSRNRWFCTQCHVPQVDARTLVGNRFKSAVEIE